MKIINQIKNKLKTFYQKHPINLYNNKLKFLIVYWKIRNKLSAKFKIYKKEFLRLKSELEYRLYSIKSDILSFKWKLECYLYFLRTRKLNPKIEALKKEYHRVLEKTYKHLGDLFIIIGYHFINRRIKHRSIKDKTKIEQNKIPEIE